MKLKRTTNKKAREFVTHLLPFQASNLHGCDFYSPIGGENMNRFYVVWSYAWYVLYAYDRVDHRWYSCKDKYSVSTSRQMSQARPDGYTFAKTQEELKELLHMFPYNASNSASEASKIA